MLGKTLSHYKVLEKIGQGGMGEVFLAQDTTLDRKVALKFLPEELEQDSTARKRFLREAKLAAALDHPYICHIHEVGEVEGKSFISMEYIQGMTLSQKLTKGPLPLKKALEVSAEIAEALEAAHKNDIVHRDLKPSNIMLTPEGHVKVMDFGLAKRVTPVEGQDEDEITTKLTKDDSLLGTIPYMSPEQLRGQEVDSRSDIFSFGVVLYEVLTGVHPFKKDGRIETANAILSETPPPLSRYSEDIPVLLQHLVKKMLTKQPDRRFQLVHDVRTDLAELTEESGDPTSEVATEPSRATSAGEWWRRAIPWGIAVLMAVIAGVAIWILTRPTPEPLSKFVITPLTTAPLVTGPGNELAISPDGRHIVYLSTSSGARLYVRSLDEFIATPIAGTEGAGVGSHFFSPDGESVAFFTIDSKLKKVSLTGGAAMTLCDTPPQQGSGSWGPEDTIVFSTATSSGLYQISAAGGEPESLATPDIDKGESNYFSPEILPGGDAVLFTISGRDGYQIAVLSLETGEQKILLERGRQARYANTGHLVYEFAGSGTLMAAPFDLATLEVTSGPVPVVQGLRRSTSLGNVDYALSDEGTLVYVPVGASVERRLVWVDREGTERLVTEEKRDFTIPRISPDGKRLALSIVGDDARDVWIYNIERDSFSRLTFEGRQNGPLIWTRDGKWITFRSTRDGLGLYQKLADGSGSAERLTNGGFNQVPTSWSPDGSVLAFHERRPETGHDIWILPMDGDRKPELFISSPNRDCCARFSPDGKWLAYVSNETGQHHVYVRPYPGPDGQWLVSGEAGGGEPVWSPDGAELFYRSADQMMVVSVQTKPTFNAGKPRLLFERAYVTNAVAPGLFQEYDISPDGQRFLMIKEAGQEATQINVVLNWFEELKRLVPTN